MARYTLLFAVSLLVGLSGCGSSTPEKKTEKGPTETVKSEGGEANTTTPPEAPKEEPAKAFVLGDMIKPFDPPTLEELNAKVQWVDRPVLDAAPLLRERQAKEKPLATVKEALALHNDTPQDNEKILSALGRLPSEEGKEVNWDANINRHSYGDVNSTNPILGSSTAEFDISGLTSFGLFSFDWNFTPFASKDTVVSWQSSKDGLYDKVVMRDDLTWSDGQPITAHDVEYSFKVILTEAVPVKAQRSGTDKLKWVKAYDDHTLVYFHLESLVTNEWNLNFSVIPKHVYEKTIEKDPLLSRIPEHVELENNPITGGPYSIKSRTRGQEIVLERRESYYMHNGKQVRDKPYFKTVRFRIRDNPSVALLALKAGDIDEMIIIPEQWRTQTNDDEFYKTNTKAYALEWTEFHFLWNCKSDLFSDKRVRQAMSYAFDHKEMIEKLRYGLDEPCNGIFNKTSKWAPQPAPKPYQQDQDKAEELLEEAGWVDTDGDGIRDKTINGKKVPFEFTVLVSSKQDRIDICTLLKQSLDQIGIKCDVKPLEFTVLIEKMTKHDFQAAFGGWGTGTDPDTSDNIWGTGQDRNYGQYSNPEVDKLFIAGRHEFDPEKRAEIYRKIHLLLYEDQPYTWLFFQNAYYGFNKSLRGYVFSPRGPYHYSPGFSSIWKPMEP
jgi:peptide/nickel transport system substrate-binding protein